MAGEDGKRRREEKEGDQKGKMDFSLVFSLLFSLKMILYWSQYPIAKNHKILGTFDKDIKFRCLPVNDTKV